MAYSSIAKPTDYFNTVTYTGNGGTNALTGVGFQPDFIWTKARSYNDDHLLVNSVTGNTAYLKSNSNGANSSSSIRVTSFNSDGFTLGSSSDINGNTDTYVGWSWLGGGSASSNSDGSITSSVSANTTAGFSIVTYTGTGSAASVGHGLGVKPDIIFSKLYSTTGDWNVYHDSFSAQERIKLNSTAAKSSNSSIFASLPTSSVVNIGTGGDINTSSGTHLFYCFTSKTGYSKFGSYVGNGNADGPFIYTGFKPAFLIFKSSSSTQNWHVIDNKRDTHNPVDLFMWPNLVDGDYAETQGVDFLSNGFKIKESGTFANGSGDTYIYMAFAENPFVANDSGTAIPTTAR